MKRIGVVGYGHLGQYLVNAIQSETDMELAFVWNRTKESLLQNLDPQLILDNLEDFPSKNPDLIVEVCHPMISEKYGEYFLQHCDYMIGSPAALAKQKLETSLRAAAAKHGLYIPTGAFWGAEDIRKMADQGTLKELQVTMRKHPSSLKLEPGELKDKNGDVMLEPVVLYKGPVRDLCFIAPNNVNTMAVAAIAAHNIGFDGVVGCLVSDPSLSGWHITEVSVKGPVTAEAEFSVTTVRKNPASPGVVTGSVTFASFLSSMLCAGNKGPGVHIC